MTTQNLLVAELRAALRRLYDPNALRSSPLVGLLNLGSEANVATALYRTLTETVAALQPSDQVPQQSRAWRTYETLYYRYVQQFSQSQVAAQLGLSVRQLRREEQAALVTLADALARRQHLRLKAADRQQAEADGQQVDETTASGAACGTAVADTGAALLGHPTAQEVADLQQVIPAVLELVAPLAARYNVGIQGPTGTFPRHVRGSPVLLRQILLSLLTVSIRANEQGLVRLSLTADRERMILCIHGADHRAWHGAITADDLANIEASRRLAQVLGIALTESAAGQACCYELALESAPSWRLLVIDDHPDAQQLLARYTKGSYYQYYGVTDPERALEQALAICPDLIVLDVMMPGIDGWQVLEWLKQAPELRGVPLAVCTVLPHRELALARGADVFIAKPVSREVFLHALDELARRRAGSHCLIA